MEQHTDGVGRRWKPHVGRRPVILLAAVAFIGAVVYAVAPVEQAEVSYSFAPIDANASGEPGDPAIAILPLLRSTADRVELSLDCEETGSQFRTLTLGNWNGSEIQFPELGLDLQVLVGDTASVSLGGREILRASVPGGDGCLVDLGFGDGLWTLRVGDQVSSVRDTGPRLVEALFVGPAARSPRSGIIVTTRELGTSPGTLQLIMLVLIAGCSLVIGRELVARGRRDGPRTPRAWRLDAVDWTVFAILIGWLVVLPPFTDDGWSASIQAGYPTHGDISGINQAGGAPWALGYWIEWTRHWWLRVSPVLAVVRLPTIVLGGLMWLGMRGVLRRLTDANRLTVWSMAAVFVVGFGAWGITTRPEPITATLALASLMFAVWFAHGRRGWVVVGWVAVLALGVSSHPSGVVVLAPLVASWRPVVTWLRSGRDERLQALLAALLLGAVAVVLVFVDSNLASKLDAASEWRSAGHAQSVLDELARYRLLGEAPFGTTLRRLSVAFLFVPVLAFATRRRPSTAVQNLPVWSLTVGLLLLTLTPSKWPLHLGSLVGVAAIAIAVEIHHARGIDGDSPRWWPVRSIRTSVVLAGTLGLLALAFSVGTRFNPFDLRSTDWWSGLDLTSPVTVIGFGALGILLLSRWAGRSPLGVVVVAAAVVGLSVTSISPVVDSIRTDGWTFLDQNAASMLGRPTCGLGDEVQVPRPGSLTVLKPGAVQAGSEADSLADAAGYDGAGAFVAGGFAPHAVSQFRPDGMNAVLPIADMPVVGSWSDTEREAAGTYRSEWHTTSGSPVILMVGGAIGDGSGDVSVGVQWGIEESGSIRSIGVETVDRFTDAPDWSIVDFVPPAGATRVRLLLSDTASGDSWVASSSPLGVELTPIADLGPGTKHAALVSPALSFYFPCLPFAGYPGPVVDPPGLVVQAWPEVWQTTFAPAVATDRYFRWPVRLDTPLPAETVGAHAGDPASLIFISQEYLTGSPARANGAFELLP